MLVDRSIGAGADILVTWDIMCAKIPCPNRLCPPTTQHQICRLWRISTSDSFTTHHPPDHQFNTAKMGRVRTKTVKKSAKVIIERYYPKLTLDFETNKRICDEIAIIASKRLRNKVSSTSSTNKTDCRKLT